MARKQDKQTIKQRNNTLNRKSHKRSSVWALRRYYFLPRIGFLRGVFLANHLASTDNLTRTTKIQNT